MTWLVVAGCAAVGGGVVAIGLGVERRFRHRALSWLKPRVKLPGGDLIVTRLERLRSQRRGALMEEQVPLLVECLILGGQSGMNLQQSLSMAAGSIPGPLRDLIEEILGLVSVGHSLEGALRKTSGRVSGRLRPLLRQLESAQSLGVALEEALLREHQFLLERQAHHLSARINTLSLKVTVLALCFLFPPLVVLVVAPGLMAFIATW